MKYTLVLRDVPEKGDDVYNALYSLWPTNLIYTLGFGVRLFAVKKNDSERAKKQTELKLASLKDNAPFNGASKISPLIPSYVLASGGVSPIDAIVVAAAHELFPSIETIYIDMGTNQGNLSGVKPLVYAFLKFNPFLKIGLIAPASEYINKESELSVYVKDTPAIIPCPFLMAGESLASQLLDIETKVGDGSHVFCLSLLPEDARDFKAITEASNIPLFVFWSFKALDGVDASTITLEAPKPPEDVYVDMQALYSATVKERPHQDAEVIGSVNATSVVKVHVLPINSDGTSWGKVMLDGKPGYIVVKHFNREKFAEVEKTNT